MDISAHRIAVLLAVHRAGGVVAAADLLRLTPSAISQQIKLLERETGVQVLERAPTGAVLTAAGKVLAETAEHIETELATARRALAGMDETAPTGTVRLGCFATALRALLLPLAVSLKEERPGLEVVIEEVVEERAGLARLRHGDIDLVLLERDSHLVSAPPRAMHDVPLLDESWLVVVPPEHPAPSTLAELVRATWIDLGPGTAGADALARLSGQLGTPLTTAHVAYDYDVVLAMVSYGMGYALLPELAVHSGYIPDGVTVTRLPGLGTRQVVVRHRATRTEPTHATRAVLEALIVQAKALELG